MLKETPEIPGRIFTPSYLAKEEKKTRRMEYHTERIVTLKIDPSLSWTVYGACLIVGTFFVLGCWYLG